MSKKPIIVFEGIEGSGKSYHLKNVEKFLKKKKYKYLKIREPGGSKNSELIRKIILNKKSNFTKNTDLLLYLAARSENVSLLKENYKKRIILIDRFVDSTLAYQHYGMGVNFNLIQLINKFLLKKIKVSFTFLNIVNKKNMNLRLKKRNTLNRYDTFDDRFYKRVQDGFIKLSKKNPKKYLIVDSNLDINENKKKNFAKNNKDY
jgi:dTMP kinase